MVSVRIPKEEVIKCHKLKVFSLHFYHNFLLETKGSFFLLGRWFKLLDMLRYLYHW
jgi:hypothetical protein